MQYISLISQIAFYWWPLTMNHMMYAIYYTKTKNLTLIFKMVCWVYLGLEHYGLSSSIFLMPYSWKSNKVYHYLMYFCKLLLVVFMISKYKLCDSCESSWVGHEHYSGDNSNNEKSKGVYKNRQHISNPYLLLFSTRFDIWTGATQFFHIGLALYIKTHCKKGRS